MSWHHLSSDWLNWADRLAPAAEKINRHLVEALDLDGLARTSADDGAGTCVLDLASGVGEPAFSIARALAGCEGRVVASDIVPGMCAGLLARARAEGIGNLSVVAADMMGLPFGDGRFDAVSCRFGVMFCPDPDLTLREARRVLRPGGRAAFMVWGPMADNPLFGAMESVLGDLAGTGFAHSGLNLFEFADPAQSMDRMKAAGFDDVTISTHQPAGRIPQTAAFWKPQMEMLFGHHLRALPDVMREKIDQAMFDALSSHIAEDHFRVPMCFHVFSGTCPA